MNSPIGRIGGKRALRKEILARFPQDGVGRYIEVFFGAGWVFFAREKQAGQLEVINDKDGNIVNLFRCIKYHREALLQELAWLIPARETFTDFCAQAEMGGLTDIQRAARFFYRLKCSFGCNERSFATDGCTLPTGEDAFAEVQKRLRGVVIENRDFESVLKTYDRPDALFYLDPPYPCARQHYANNFSDADHERLAACLKTLKGRFVLSYNDDASIRRLYEGWCSIEPVRRPETLSGQKGNRPAYHEIIIKNY